MNKLKKLLIFLRSAFYRYKLTNANQLAGSLAFVSILALVPLFTVILIILTLNPELTQASKYLRQYLEYELLPSSGSKVIVQYLTSHENLYAQAI